MLRKTLTSALMLIIWLLPSAVFALDMEYYTYGGFDVIVNAFNQLVLIFGDSSYTTIYYITCVMGIFCGVAIAVVKIVCGRQTNILAWAPIVAFGVALYLAMFVPKGNIAVYDPVYNKSQIVANVPVGVVAIAGVMNAVERSIVDIISNAADPMSFQREAGGAGYSVLYSMLSNPVANMTPGLRESLYNYTNDCVAFALKAPSSGLTVDELKSGTRDFRTSFAKAANPANMTVYVDSAGTQSDMTCKDAWTAVQTDINTFVTNNSSAGANSDFIKGVCANAGFNPSSITDLQLCMTSLTNIMTAGDASVTDINNILTQYTMSVVLDEVFRSSSSTRAANYNFQMGAAGAMTAANQWIPILRAALVAIALSLIPLLAIFLPTPLAGRALGVMCGLFIWITVWGICDAIMHNFIISYASNVWQQVRSNGLAMDAFYFMPDQTYKILGMFGNMRMGGLVLATAITGALVKFGGHALAMLASNITGQVQAAGKQASDKTIDPAGNSQAVSQSGAAWPTQAWANQAPLSDRQMQVWSKKTGETRAYDTLSNSMGGPQSVANLDRDAAVGSTVYGAGRGQGAEKVGIPNALAGSAFTAATGYEAGLTKREAFHDNAKEAGGVSAASDVQMALTAKTLGMTPSGLANSIAGLNTMTSAQRNSQIHNMADKYGKGYWKKNPELYDAKTGHVTQKGFASFVAAMEGTGIRYTGENGIVRTAYLNSDGKVAMIEGRGTVSGREARALANKADKEGFHSEAAQLRELANKGPVMVDFTTDGYGRIASFNAIRGGTVAGNDLATSRRGRDDQTLDVAKNVHDHRNMDLEGTQTVRGHSTLVDNATLTRYGTDTQDLSRKTIDNYSGPLGDYNYERASIDIRGNTYTATGKTTDGAQVTSTGTIEKTSRGIVVTTLTASDKTGMHYSPEAALKHVMVGHNIPKAAMKDEQSRRHFADALSQSFTNIRRASNISAQDSSFGLSGAFGSDKSGAGSAGQGSSRSIKAGGHASISNTDRVAADIDYAQRNINRILANHPNTPEGRRLAAEELQKYYKNYMKKTSTRTTDFIGGPEETQFFNGGKPYEPKD